MTTQLETGNLFHFASQPSQVFRVTGTYLAAGFIPSVSGVTLDGTHRTNARVADVVALINACDHGHDTSGETRLLPIGGGGNVIVCRRHYDVEIAFRLERWPERTSASDLPMWESLTVYSAA